MNRDIENREDLFLLVKVFYKKLLNDPAISYLFTEVTKIDLNAHLPILVDFWDMVLFQKDTYRKNAIQPHIHLHSLSPFTKQHFQTWIKYFTETVDELFEGNIAFQAKQRAQSIATVMEIKMAQLK